MDEAVILQELETLAEDLSVELRYDELEGPGGMCRFGGRACVIVNRDLPLAERLRVVGGALARLSLEDIFIRPQVRDFLESCAPVGVPAHPARRW